MKFVLDTLIVFFATLAVAALVALGEPVDSNWLWAAPEQQLSTVHTADSRP
ncbi:MAG: hypothetical protein ACXWC6_02775 [Ramlibacter sp.]